MISIRNIKAIFSALSICAPIALGTVSCGKVEEKPSSLEEAKANGIELSFFGQKIRVEDKMYRVECNPYYVSFLLTASSNGCKAGSAKMESIAGKHWTFKFADTTLGTIEGDQVDEKIKVGGTPYYCHIATGSIYMETSDFPSYGGYLILAKTLATKPSDLKTDDVLLVGAESSFCSALTK